MNLTEYERVCFKYDTKASRDKVDPDDFAGPDESFPIQNQEDVTHAAMLLHHAANPSAVKAKIKSIAKRKGLEMPSTWSDGDKKSTNHSFAGFDLDVRVEEGGEYVLRTGKLFECGAYPDKEFVLTEDEADAAIADFQPVPLNLEHVVGADHIPSILDGKLGLLQKVWRVGKDIFARYAIPHWLHRETKGAPVKISSEWSVDKKIVGAALVLHPRVADAAVFAAFSTLMTKHDTPHGKSTLQYIHDMAARAGARCDQGNGKANMTSAHEAKAFQSIHDTAVQHGALCLDAQDGVYYNDNPPAKSGTEASAKMKLSAKALFKTLFGGKEEIEFPTEDDDGVATSSGGADFSTHPRFMEMCNEIKALKQANEKLTEHFAAESKTGKEREVATFVEAAIKDRKLPPAAREAYVSLGLADLESLKKAVASMTSVAAYDTPAEKTGAEESVSKERVKELLEKSTLGRAMLVQESIK